MSAPAVCHHHPDRSAVAKCPGCGLVFCRECVSEHNGRILCANCLKSESRAAEVAPKKSRASILPWIWKPLRIGLAVFFLWFAFYAIGRTLLNIPASFHKGTYWEEIFDV